MLDHSQTIFIHSRTNLHTHKITLMQHFTIMQTQTCIGIQTDDSGEKKKSVELCHNFNWQINPHQLLTSDDLVYSKWWRIVLFVRGHRLECLYVYMYTQTHTHTSHNFTLNNYAGELLNEIPCSS